MTSFSYCTGVKGRSRVRVFQREERDSLLLEWYEGGKRCTRTLGHRDTARGREEAHQLSAELQLGRSARPEELTLQALFDKYDREKPEKSEGKRAHDKHVRSIAFEVFGRHALPARFTHRDAARFVSARRELGDLRPGRTKGNPVGPRVLVYDLRHMLAVFNWAVRGGLLERNPWTGYRVPEAGKHTPRRIAVTGPQFDAVLSVSSRISPNCTLLLLVVNETGHRVGAVRQLRWSDVDLASDAPMIRWRGTGDKMGYEHATYCSPSLVEVLRSARAARPAIGDAWIFPSPANSTKPASSDLVRGWWQELEVLVRREEGGAQLLPAQPGRGWHSLRRKFATEMKNVPLTDLCALGGWKSPQTVLQCYMRPDARTQRRALADRMRFEA